MKGFICRRCGAVKQGNPIRIAFFVWDGKELSEGWLPEELLNAVGEDVCGSCAQYIRGMMRMKTELKKEKKDSRGRKSEISQKTDKELLMKWRKGRSMRELADEYGWCEQTIRNHIHLEINREQKNDP